jgi:DNA-damage-inducible protein D
MKESQDSSDMPQEGEAQIALFEKRSIRRGFHRNEWYFSVVDIVQVLTDSADPTQYIRRIRSRDQSLNKGWVQIVLPLSIETAGGLQLINCANLEGIFRIIQSIPSPKADPFKRWLARVGYERIQETQDPAIAIKRAILQYQIQGRENDWINRRIKGLVARKGLTDEWNKRGVKEPWQYGALTNLLSTETFGIDTTVHKKLKGLPAKGKSLRDNMTEIELTLTELAELSTKKIAEKSKALGFFQNQGAAISGGRVAGKARKALEEELGESVVSIEAAAERRNTGLDPIQLSMPGRKPPPTF